MVRKALDMPDPPMRCHVRSIAPTTECHCADHTEPPSPKQASRQLRVTAAGAGNDLHSAT
eukprot:4256903-Alexandrium_andersonii.AAC.1